MQQRIRLPAGTVYELIFHLQFLETNLFFIYDLQRDDLARDDTFKDFFN